MYRWYPGQYGQVWWSSLWFHVSHTFSKTSFGMRRLATVKNRNMTEHLWLELVFFLGGWWAVVFFCSHCFQGCNFVAISLYQNKLVKSVHQDKGLSFTSSVIFPKLDRFHWGNCGALWWCWRAGVKGWQGDFSGIGEGGFGDWLLKGLECRFVAVVFENPCRSM